MTLPREIVLVLEQIQDDLGLSRNDLRPAFRLMTRHIAGMWVKGNAAYFGPMFEDALRRVREANLGSISAGPAIDLSRLHRSNKTKSGFVGVYANGGGFRAMARVKGVETYIGQFPSAEEAAWKRRLYYLEHKLPYGELEDTIQDMRSKIPHLTNASTERLVQEAAGMMHDSGMSELIAPDLRDMGLRLVVSSTGDAHVEAITQAEPSVDEDPGTIEPMLKGFSPEAARALLK